VNFLNKLNIIFIFTMMLWLCAIPFVQNQIGISPNFDTELCEEENSGSARVIEEEPHKLFCHFNRDENAPLIVKYKESFQNCIAKVQIQPAFKVTVPPPEC